MESSSTKVKPDLKVGDLVRCLDADGYEPYGFAVGGRYTVAEVEPGERGGPTLLGFKELIGGKASMFAHRFELMKRGTFKVGDTVRCIDPVRHQRFGVEAGKTYTVKQVLYGRRGPTMLKLWEILGGKGPLFAHHFELVPHIGTLDEYGAVSAPVPAIFSAIGKKWPAHPADAVIQLDELRNPLK